MSNVSPDIDIVPFNHEFSTLERAVKERVFRVKEGTSFVETPKPLTGHFASELGEFRRSLCKLLPKTAPWTHQRFVDSYQGRKKVVYTEALEKLRCGYSNLQKDASVNVFIKNEKTDRTTKSDPVPRVISPRSPLFNLRVGRYLKRLEHKMFKAIGRLFNHPTVIKGYDIHKSASLLREKWDMFDNPIAIGLDASRFDQHVSIEALKFEHKIYLDCFPEKKHKARLRKLLNCQLRNRCNGYTPDGRLAYVTEGTRMSGDMNTSLGNTLLMCGMIWSFAKSKNVNIQLANNGDDCVIFMEKKDEEHFSLGLHEWFIKLGFNMVVETPVDSFERIEFCQTKPVFDGSRYVMCRNPISAVAKDSVMLSPYQSIGKFMGWLDSVGMCGLAMTGGLPIFQSFYKLYIRSGAKRKIPDNLLSWNMQMHLKYGVVRDEKPITDEARCSFWEAFGIVPDEQLLIERYYDNMFICPKLGVDYAPRSVFACS